MGSDIETKLKPPMLNFTTLVDHAEDEKKVLDVIHRVNSDLHDVALTAVIKDIRFFTNYLV